MFFSISSVINRRCRSDPKSGFVEAPCQWRASRLFIGEESTNVLKLISYQRSALQSVMLKKLVLREPLHRTSTSDDHPTSGSSSHRKRCATQRQAVLRWTTNLRDSMPLLWIDLAGQCIGFQHLKAWKGVRGKAFSMKFICEQKFNIREGR